MPGRLEILCVVTIVSWLGGLACYGWLNASQTSWVTVVLVGALGVIAGPLLGAWMVVALPDFFEWESTGPRDFYLPAIAISAALCFGLPMLLFWF